MALLAVAAARQTDNNNEQSERGDHGGDDEKLRLSRWLVRSRSCQPAFELTCAGSESSESHCVAFSCASRWRRRRPDLWPLSRGEAKQTDTRSRELCALERQLVALDSLARRVRLLCRCCRRQRTGCQLGCFLARSTTRETCTIRSLLSRQLRPSNSRNFVAAAAPLDSTHADTNAKKSHTHTERHTRSS